MIADKNELLVVHNVATAGPFLLRHRVVVQRQHMTSFFLPSYYPNPSMSSVRLE